jgi:hypothetical protein
MESWWESVSTCPSPTRPMARTYTWTEGLSSGRELVSSGPGEEFLGCGSIVRPSSSWASSKESPSGICGRTSSGVVSLLPSSTARWDSSLNSACVCAPDWNSDCCCERISPSSSSPSSVVELIEVICASPFLRLVDLWTTPYWANWILCSLLGDQGCVNLEHCAVRPSYGLSRCVNIWFEGCLRSQTNSAIEDDHATVIWIWKISKAK